ncbi:MAG: nitrile hydratase accessory protein [Rubrivivax sp.]
MNLSTLASSAIAADPVATEPVFAEPWQAQAFAMAVHLHARGLFSWPEWAQALAQTIAGAAQPDPDGSAYYRHWLATLERLVAEKGAATAGELATCAAAWDHAADRTPHGDPIVLRTTDYAASDNGATA